MSKAAWKRVKLGEILQERQGRFKPNDEAITSLRRIEKIDFSGTIVLSEKSSNTDMIVIHPGDLVISGINVAKGALAMYYGEKPIAATIHYSSYECNQRLINIAFLQYFLKSTAFLQILKEQVPGGIKTEIKAKHLLPLEIAIPPLEEQERIAAHIERVTAHHAALKQELTHQQALLAKLREAILREAVQGKLTHQSADDEDASHLLARIKAEKAAKGIKEKPLPPIKPEEIPYELPQGWVWCRLGDAIELISGQHIEVMDYNMTGEGIPYLTGPADFGDIHPLFTKWTLKPKVSANQGDILITVKGSGVGKTNILHTNNVAIARQLMAVRPIAVNRMYVHFFLKTQFIHFQAEKDGQIPGISREDVLCKLIPLPPLAEQQRIVAAVERLLGRVTALEQEVLQQQETLGRLMQSALREAFGGSSNHKNRSEDE